MNILLARSGALATFLVDNGYELNPNYNTRFAPNEVILEIFKEIIGFLHLIKY